MRGRDRHGGWSGGFLFFISFNLESALFLTARFHFQGDLPWMASQPSWRHGCRIDGGPALSAASTRAVRKMRFQVPAYKKQKSPAPAPSIPPPHSSLSPRLPPSAPQKNRSIRRYCDLEIQLISHSIKQSYS